MKRAQLLAPAGELAALPVVARGPLDREVDVVGDEVERGVRIGPVEGGEVALEEASCRGPAELGGLRREADERDVRSVKKPATRSRATIPFGRYQCQMLL